MNSGKNLKSLKLLFWISFVLALLFFVLDNEEKNLNTFLISFLVSVLYTFGYSVCNFWLNHTLDQYYPWRTQTKERAIAAVVGTVVLNVLLTYVLNYINFVIIQKVPADEFFSRAYGFINWIFINIALLISAFLHDRGFMMSMKQSAKSEVIEQKLIAKSAHAQFESLKNQLDPHFLFNSLNVLSSLIDENPIQAQSFTVSMSKIYRYVLEQKDKDLVSVEEEIDFAKTFVGLLETRFEDAVQFDFRIPKEVESNYIVPLSLQLLLENSIKHNFATSQNPLRIQVYVDGDYLVVENNAQLREVENDRQGIGLANIVQRYALMCDQNVFIEKSPTFFRVKLPILTSKKKKMNTQNFNPDENQAYTRAAKRVRELKSFYGNLISYCLVIPFLIFVNLSTSPEYHWFWWPMLGWGIGVASHALQTFGIGREWEERKIKELMDKEKRN